MLGRGGVAAVEYGHCAWGIESVSQLNQVETVETRGPGMGDGGTGGGRPHVAAATAAAAEGAIVLQAVIRGPRDTPWEQGKFTVWLVYPAGYDTEPPTAWFVGQVPCHPNIVRGTGKACIDFLDQPTVREPLRTSH